MTQGEAGGASWTVSRLRHDLRNALNQVLGYGALVEEELEGATSPSIMQDLSRLGIAARHALQLVDTHLVGDHPARSADDGSAPRGPTKPAAAPAAERAPDDRVPMLTGDLLVVDDDAGNLDLLARRLRKEGHTVHLATNGAEALERLRSTPIDMVLLDLMMPVLDGYDTLRLLREDAALRHLPVIMISGNDEFHQVVRCVELGADDYLQKPVDPTLLRARIRAALERMRFRQQEAAYLQQIVSTQRRLQEELDNATNYVRSILPPVGRRGAVDVDWRLIPSTELGGDAFGYHAIDDEHTALYLLDVCGHGVGAALLSVAAINVLRTGALPHVDFRDPGAVLTGLNSAFQMDANNGMYFTVWYGVWHAPSRTLSYAAAGHPPAVLVPESDALPPEAVGARGFVLGGLPGTRYATTRRTVPARSHLYLVSDGVFEIERPDGSWWGEAGLHAWLGAERAPADLDALLVHVQQQRGAPSLDDDFSILRITL